MQTIVYDMTTSTLYVAITPASAGPILITVPAGSMHDYYVGARRKCLNPPKPCLLP